MLGAGYYQETGIMLNSSYARANVLFNMSVQPTKEIRIDGRIYGAYVDKSFNERLHEKINMRVCPLNPTTKVPCCKAPAPCRTSG
ncbi:MAG: hypothetical protein V8R91_11375 [Butyricimonas faecihominis]